MLIPETINGPWFLYLAGFVFLGIVLGSFASALIHRIPHNISVFKMNARSSCPRCDHILNLKDLLPVLSWVFSKGQCRYCDKKISPLYPALEILSGALAALIFWHFQGQPIAHGLIYVLTLPILLSLLVTDIRHKILPNILVLILASLGIAVLILRISGGMDAQAALIEYLGGGLLYMGIALIISLTMEKIMKKQALGMGDVKFFGAAGLWLGLSNFALFCILGGILGVTLGLVWQKIRSEAAFPFGPALIAAFFVILLL